jgi:putative FmdB family regulatory protein
VIKIAVYKYKCPKCGEIELNKSMNDPDFKVCPNCDNDIERIYTLGGIVWNCEGNYGKGL